MTLYITQAASGGPYTISSTAWPGTVTWFGGTAPAMPSTAGGVLAVQFQTTTGGTSWYGFVISNAALPLPVQDGGTGLNALAPFQVMIAGTATQAVQQQPLNALPSVQEATTTTLPTYTATATTLQGSANGALPAIDTVTVQQGDRLLVKNETGGNLKNNGVYLVSVVGSGGAKYLLTRAPDMTDLTPNTVQVPGSYTFVEQGSQAGTLWGVANAGPFTIGTTAINWTQIGSGGGTVTSVTAGDTSIVVGGTGAAPTIATATLDVIAADHPPAANWSNNSHKITSLTPGSASTDAATYGQTAAGGSTVAVANGGTNVTSLTGYELLAANSAGTAVTQVGPGTAGQVLISQGSSALPAYAPPDPLWGPADNGFLGAAYDPAMITTTGTPSAGQLVLWRIPLRAAQTITHCLIGCSALATSGTTSTGTYLGIYTASAGTLTLQAATADCGNSTYLVAGGTATNGLVTVPLSGAGSYAASAGFIYVGFLYNMSATPTLYKTGFNQTACNMGLTTSTGRLMGVNTYGTAIGTPGTTTITMSSLSLTVGSPWWFGVS